MSCWSTRRGQTEPIAALLAVALVALAVATYAGALGDVLPGQSDRVVAEATADRAWTDLRSGGVYWTRTLTLDGVDPDVLPRGRTAQFEIELLTGDGWVTDSAVAYTPDGDRRAPAPPPDRAQVLTRPIPVRTNAGVVRTGRLTVAVWTP